MDTTAVPPAATKGWYPNPLVDPTDVIILPRGIVAVFESYETEVAEPVNVMLVIPDVCDKL